MSQSQSTIPSLHEYCDRNGIGKGEKKEPRKAQRMVGHNVACNRVAFSCDTNNKPKVGNERDVRVTPVAHPPYPALQHHLSLSFSYGQQPPSALYTLSPSILLQQEEAARRCEESDAPSATISETEFPGLAPGRKAFLPSAHFTVTQQVAQRTVEAVLSRLPPCDQERITCTPAAVRLTSSEAFATMMSAICWAAIINVRRIIGGRAAEESASRSMEDVFHVFAEAYSHAYILGAPCPNQFAVMAHKDHVFNAIPMLLARCAYFLLTDTFTATQDEVYFDKKLRHFLLRKTHLWIVGFVPEQMNLNNWARRPKQQTSYAWHSFCEEDVTQKMESAVQHQMPLWTQSHSQKSLLATPSPRNRGLTLSTGTRSPPIQTPASSSLKPLASPRPPKGKASPRKAKGTGVLPVLDHWESPWYLQGRMTGRLCAQRATEAKTARPSTQHLTAASPAIQHCLQEAGVEVTPQVGCGIRGDISWSSLTPLDRKRVGLTFSKLADPLARRANTMLRESRVAEEGIRKRELNDLIVSQQRGRYLQGKLRFAQKQLTAIYSRRNPETKRRLESLRAVLLRALRDDVWYKKRRKYNESGSSPQEIPILPAQSAPEAAPVVSTTSPRKDKGDPEQTHIKRVLDEYACAIEHVEGSLFDIPLPHREELHQLLWECRQRQRFLRRLAACLDAKTTFSFGESVTLDDDLRGTLDSLYSSMLQTPSKPPPSTRGGASDTKASLDDTNFFELTCCGQDLQRLMGDSGEDEDDETPQANNLVPQRESIDASKHGDQQPSAEDPLGSLEQSQRPSIRPSDSTSPEVPAPPFRHPLPPPRQRVCGSVPCPRPVSQRAAERAQKQQLP